MYNNLILRYLLSSLFYSGVQEIIECILNTVLQCYLNFIFKKRTSVLPWLDKKVLKFTLTMLGWDHAERKRHILSTWYMYLNARHYIIEYFSGRFPCTWIITFFVWCGNEPFLR